MISPEGCAAILWKSGEYAQQAAELLKMTSKELKRFDLIDEVIREPLGGAHRNPEQAAANVERYLSQTLRSMKRTKIDTLLERRYKRLRELGAFFEVASTKSNGRVKKAAAQALAASGSAARS